MHDLLYCSCCTAVVVLQLKQMWVYTCGFCTDDYNIININGAHSGVITDMKCACWQAGDHSDCVAVGEGTLAAHYAYKPQEERLTRFTSVFQHYEALANAVTGGLSM